MHHNIWNLSLSETKVSEEGKSCRCEEDGPYYEQSLGGKGQSLNWPREGCEEPILSAICQGTQSAFASLGELTVPRQHRKNWLFTWDLRAQTLNTQRLAEFAFTSPTSSSTGTPMATLPGYNTVKKYSQMTIPPTLKFRQSNGSQRKPHS